MPQYARFRDPIELSVTLEGLRISLSDDAKAPLFKDGALATRRALVSGGMHGARMLEAREKLAQEKLPN